MEADGSFWNRILGPPWLNYAPGSEATCYSFKAAMERRSEGICWEITCACMTSPSFSLLDIEPGRLMVFLLRNVRDG
jgi:hypothetical protein